MWPPFRLEGNGSCTWQSPVGHSCLHHTRGHRPFTTPEPSLSRRGVGAMDARWDCAGPVAVTVRNRVSAWHAVCNLTRGPFTGKRGSMFNKNRHCCVVASLTLGLSACSAEVNVEPEVGALEQALDSCNTNTGKWQHLANLAVATAQEMGELNSSKQYTVVPWNGGEKVALSPYGAAVCAERGGCPTVQGILDLQEMVNNTYVPQELFNTIDYRNTIVDGFKRQAMQIDQLVANNQWSQLPEDNATTLIGQDGTSTCGTPWYSFSVKRDFHLQFSSAGPIAGMNCTAITEPYDPHGWSDNYLCSERA